MLAQLHQVPVVEALPRDVPGLGGRDQVDHAPFFRVRRESSLCRRAAQRVACRRFAHRIVMGALNAAALPKRPRAVAHKARSIFGGFRLLGSQVRLDGGIALGLDRLVMLICGEESIRQVMAFPKNNRGQELMTQSPAEVDPRQLRELGIKPGGDKQL